MRRSREGFTLMELLITMGLLAVLVAMTSFSYRIFEAKFRCKSAAAVLAMDIRLQQQRARRLDSEQGLYFLSPTRYRLGHMSGTLFVDNNPPRAVDLNEQYSGVSIIQVGAMTAFPCFAGFSPESYEAGEWVPLSGFSGDIIIKGGSGTVYVRVAPDTRAISTEIH